MYRPEQMKVVVKEEKGTIVALGVCISKTKRREYKPKDGFKGVSGGQRV
jgi:hypothetical protein